MAEAKFTFEGQDIIIQCNKNQKMRDICTNLSTKINIGLNSLVFLYGGGKLNLEKTFQELTKENRISILVDKYENEEICPKCGRILNNEIINEIISSNNNTNLSLIGIKRQIETIMTDINNNVDNNYIISQLRNINVVINNINEDIKKMNAKLNMSKLNDSKIINQNNKNEENKKEERPKNEITCIYNKQKTEIDLLHDYTFNTNGWNEEPKKSYIEGKNNINENNIDIYINDKKIKFNYKYKSNEKGNIKVKFIFKKLLTGTNHMFWRCSALQSINLSSFNTTNVEDMSDMFSNCSSLQSINLASFNTLNVKNMNNMFCECSSLKSIDLSSFNTTNVKDMKGMFSNCSSLKSIDLSSFNTTNVKDMLGMFYYCSSLQSIDLSSLNTTNVKDMRWMFYGCSSLKKENVKISSYGKKILDELNKI